MERVRGTHRKGGGIFRKEGNRFRHGVKAGRRTGVPGEIPPRSAFNPVERPKGGETERQQDRTVKKFCNLRFPRKITDNPTNGFSSDTERFVFPVHFSAHYVRNGQTGRGRNPLP